ncbi:MAG: GerMN domain-containing protein [Micromonosporaceae bacterium]|nr:GerMN domain-containing protein [Micromonosporaceae bacterium]
MSRRSAAVVGALLTAAALAGCGVSPESEPHPIDPPRGPFRAITSPTPSAARSGAITQRLYLVKDGKLVAVTRHADVSTVDALVSQLLSGPTEAERDSGLTSAIQGAVAVSAVHVEGDLATVELSSPVAETRRNDNLLAYAQLVCTLTTRPEIKGVMFTHDQTPVGVPRGDGSLSLGPLTRADYADLIEPG